MRTGTEERLDRRQRQHRVVRLVFAVQRQEDVGVDPAEALQLQHLAADRDLAVQHRELRILAGHRGVGAHGLRQQHLHRLRHLTPMIATVSGRAPILGALVMMPAFSPAIPAMSSPRYSTWSMLIGVITATGASITLVASQRPPRPTSIDRDVDGRIGERRERHRGEDLELAHRRAAGGLRLLVDHLHERLDLAVGLHVLAPG